MIGQAADRQLARACALVNLPQLRDIQNEEFEAMLAGKEDAQDGARQRRQARQRCSAAGARPVGRFAIAGTRLADRRGFPSGGVLPPGELVAVTGPGEPRRSSPTRSCRICWSRRRSRSRSSSSSGRRARRSASRCCSEDPVRPAAASSSASTISAAVLTDPHYLNSIQVTVVFSVATAVARARLRASCWR